MWSHTHHRTLALRFHPRRHGRSVRCLGIDIASSLNAAAPEQTNGCIARRGKALRNVSPSSVPWAIRSSPRLHPPTPLRSRSIRISCLPRRRHVAEYRLDDPNGRGIRKRRRWCVPCCDGKCRSLRGDPDGWMRRVVQYLRCSCHGPLRGPASSHCTSRRSRRSPPPPTAHSSGDVLSASAGAFDIDLR